MSRPTVDPPLPGAIRLEACSACQLRCPSCPTTTGATRRVVGKGHLRARDFLDFLDAHPEIEGVELSNWGEVLLNPELVDLLAGAHDRGVVLSCENGVNLNHATEQQLAAIVRYGVVSLVCSIDGATQESYSRYRVGGDLTRVIRHVERLNELKREAGTRYPLLTWQFVVFGHNEHELPRAREWAASLDMAFSPKIAWDDRFSPVEDEAMVRRETGLARSHGAHEEAEQAPYLGSLCHQMWLQPQINWDGKLLGCCVNIEEELGPNVFEAGLATAFHSDKMRYARGMLAGDLPPRDDIPCSRCSFYLAMQRQDAWVTRERLDHHPPADAYRFHRSQMANERAQPRDAT